jgi:hypothetical protein
MQREYIGPVAKVPVHVSGWLDVWDELVAAALFLYLL